MTFKPKNSKQAKMAHKDELNHNTKPESIPTEVFMAAIMTPMDVPSPLKTATELENELLSMRDDMWRMAAMRRRGKSIPQIVKAMKEQYDKTFQPQDVSWAIKKVLNLNFHLAVHDGNLLRQSMLDELDGYLDALYEEVKETNKLTSTQIPLALSIADRKIKLLGINAPEKIDLSINGTIKVAQEKLQEQIKRFKEVIDVTPEEEINNTIENIEKEEKND